MNEQERALQEFNNVWRKLQEAMEAISVQAQSVEQVNGCETNFHPADYDELERMYKLESPK